MRAGYHVRKQALIWRGRLLLGWLRLVQRASGALGLRNLYHRHLGALVRGTGLVDAARYLGQNPDRAPGGAGPPPALGTLGRSSYPPDPAHHRS